MKSESTYFTIHFTQKQLCWWNLESCILGPTQIGTSGKDLISLEKESTVATVKLDSAFSFFSPRKKVKHTL